jgi:putative ubiquitin-RnfH superfamily antitoxin RatB of RatAB toxin-antitoxin module
MTLRVVVVHTPGPRTVQEVSLALAEGSTVADAIAAAGLCTPLKNASVGIWGRLVPPHQTLQDLDRVEIYRPLKVDPKVARRTRFAAQGVKKAGLFADKRKRTELGQ